MNKLFGKLIFIRLSTSLLIIFLVISFVFILVRISPGSPVQKFISPKLSPKLAEQVMESFSLHEPLYSQYFSFLGNVVQGDFGISYSFRAKVTDVIAKHIPVTFILAFFSIIIQLLLSLLLSLIAVRKLNGIVDNLISKSALILFTVPSFVMGVFLILVFSVKLNLLPSSDLKSIDHYSYNFWNALADYAKHLILPLITLSAAGTAVFYKYLRDNIEVVLSKNFVLYLTANGYSRWTIILKHVVPNSLGPLISVAGVELGILLSGTLITEVIFGLPGMGRLTIDAINSRDYPLIIGCTTISAIFIVFANFASDLIRAVIDKRILKESLS